MCPQQRTMPVSPIPNCRRLDRPRCRNPRRTLRWSDTSTRTLPTRFVTSIAAFSADSGQYEPAVATSTTVTKGRGKLAGVYANSHLEKPKTTSTWEQWPTSNAGDCLVRADLVFHDACTAIRVATTESRRPIRRSPHGKVTNLAASKERENLVTHQATRSYP